jgi:hypothetical protein
LSTEPTDTGPEKSEKVGLKSSALRIIDVLLERDPGSRQRAREVPLLYNIASPEGGLAGDLEDFVSKWLEENVPWEIARALAWRLGEKQTLRAAALMFGLRHQELSIHNRRLAEAVKEIL